jgi:hypothetical protein
MRDVTRPGPDVAAICRDQRGVALPMAMMVTVLLTTLMLAFVVLGESEPVVARNQLRATQARVQAEAGFERAVWALSQGVIAPGTSGTLASPLPSPTPSPYNGSTFIANGRSGGYVVTVTSPSPAARPNERQITSVGWTPTNSAADQRTKSHRRIQATVERLPAFGPGTPCVLCARGDVALANTTLIDATTDTSCGNKKGVVAMGDVDINNNAKIRGADGNSTTNQEGGDYLEDVTDADVFAAVTLNAQHLKLLRELARRNGTYFGPGYPKGTAAASPTWSGSITFNSSNKVRNGIVFVDTKSGNDIPAAVADQVMSDFASVTINGSPFTSGTFAGWIVVNGSVSISGSMKMNGLLYVVNDLTYNASGSGEIQGMAVAQSIRDPEITVSGSSRIKFSCANLTAPSGTPRGFALVPGTYRELSD